MPGHGARWHADGRRQAGPLAAGLRRLTNDIRDLIDTAYAARREALRLCRDREDRTHLATALLAVGQIERDAGRPAAARPHYEEAVSLRRDAADDLATAHALRHLGDLYQELDKLQEAEAVYQEVLAIYDDADGVPPLTLANALRPLAMLKDRLGEAEPAQRHWRRALSLYEATDVEAGIEECRARLAERSDKSGA